MYSLPTKEQFQELIDSCQWDWNEGKKGYDIIGPNRNSIFLPALEFKFNKENEVRNGSPHGCYWSSTEYSSSNGYYLVFYSGYLGIDYASKSDYYFSVRLVQAPANGTSSQFIDLALPSGTLWAKSNATKEYLNWRQAQEFVKKLNKIIDTMRKINFRNAVMQYHGQQ